MNAHLDHMHGMVINQLDIITFLTSTIQHHTELSSVLRNLRN